jgi:hypothetical protein
MGVLPPYGAKKQAPACDASSRCAVPLCLCKPGDQCCRQTENFYSVGIANASAKVCGRRLLVDLDPADGPGPLGLVVMSPAKERVVRINLILRTILGKACLVRIALALPEDDKPPATRRLKCLALPDVSRITRGCPTQEALLSFGMSSVSPVLSNLESSRAMFYHYRPGRNTDRLRC